MQWRFGPFRLDLDHGCLWHGDARVVLRPKTFDLLAYLVEHAGELISKEELFTAIWPGTVVAESALTVSVSELRKALGETAGAPQYIATVHRRGYRFIALVTPIESPTPFDPFTTLNPPGIGIPPLVAERRQLTVLFCDLVDSTRLAGQLDPEDLREVLQAYHQTCAEVVERFEGYVAQYLGDGVLVYFGYPVAHEDDAQRAVWSALGLLEALKALNTRLALPSENALAVRLGLHTGVVVVSNVGSGKRQEPLAQGETPYFAAHLQTLAGPHEIVISSATRELLGGIFRLKDLGEQALMGGTAPMQVYRIEGVQAIESRFEAMTLTGLTPLVGREEELKLLRRRWQQAIEGEGQVILLSGEAGLGKSRLIQTLCERLDEAPYLRMLYQCSPYHTHSAFSPIITHLQRTLQLEQVSLPAAKLDRLETWLSQAAMAVAEVAPLLASMLSIPIGERYDPLTLSPEQQKEQTLSAWAELLVSLSQRQPVLAIFEDVHWSDPSTLETLAYVIDRVQEARVLLVLTFRPEFVPSWGRYTHITTYTLNRLTRRQVVAMVERIAGCTQLPAALVEQIVTKTDGIPLFVEELTKTALESACLQDDESSDPLAGLSQPLSLPTTLQDALMARLDRLPSAREIAQVAAVLGREFAYDMLRAIVPMDGAALQHGLAQLVQVELLHQRGHPPRAHYLFKHALVQEAAYASLLRRRRREVHQAIAQVLERQFPETVETQPELVAHHYTAAGRMQEAMGYWQQAGQSALARSAYTEAAHHLRTGLAVLGTLPEAPERMQHELAMQTNLGSALIATQGHAHEEIARIYSRARELCEQVGQMPQLFPVLWGLWRGYTGRAQHQQARELGEQFLSLAQRTHQPIFLTVPHAALGFSLLCLGNLVGARHHLERAMACYDRHQHTSLTVTYGQNPGVGGHTHAAWVQWLLGYPDQAWQHLHTAACLAQELVYPYTQALTFAFTAYLYMLCREPHLAHQQAEAAITLGRKWRFPMFLEMAQVIQGWTCIAQGRAEEGVNCIRQGLASIRAIGIEALQPMNLGMLAEALGAAGRPEEGREVLVQALEVMERTGERFYEAELHRLQGELLLQCPGADIQQAEAHFHQAMGIARQQQAKSLELRAATSLARFWQQQGKRNEARALLGPRYLWFTEGFDTANLRDAKALLDELTSKQ